MNSIEEEMAQVALATEKDLDETVQAAADAFPRPDWRRLLGTDKGKLIGLMENNCTSLASAEPLNTGKAYRIALEGDKETLRTPSRLSANAGFADKSLWASYQHWC
ncbi:hypothetical protein LB505_002907 [Fusarium chuoi]|nr:hypothetical protein LB505_002907 [Fusarium chuoi]